MRASSGGWFDPAIAAAFVTHGPALLAEIAAEDALAAAIAAEPQPWRRIRGDGITTVARAFADMAGLKSTYTAAHSPGVRQLAEPASASLGLDAEAVGRLGVAALLHDLGRVAVPAGTWERRGALNAADRERIRLHPYYSERVLARAPALADVAALAGLHHERLDGSGYHRGAHARELPLTARVLAVADTFRAKTEPRPHRQALAVEQAAAFVTGEARAGRLDVNATAAVLAAAGAPRTRIVAAAPAGLTERECDTLRLLATGCSNREIAERLVISPRTAEHHVQHIYEKLGVSTRAAAIMFALQHDLVSPADG